MTTWTVELSEPVEAELDRIRLEVQGLKQRQELILATVLAQADVPEGGEVVGREPGQLIVEIKEE